MLALASVDLLAHLLGWSWQRAHGSGRQRARIAMDAVRPRGWEASVQRVMRAWNMIAAHCLSRRSGSSAGLRVQHGGRVAKRGWGFLFISWSEDAFGGANCSLVKPACTTEQGRPCSDGPQTSTFSL